MSLFSLHGHVQGLSRKNLNFCFVCKGEVGSQIWQSKFVIFSFTETGKHSPDHFLFLD